MTKRIAIDIVSDAVCPWCFVGKRRLEAALAQAPKGLEFEIGWRPFQLNPDMPEGGMARADYLGAKFGGEARAKQIYKRIEEAAASAGLALEFGAIGRTPNTVDAHRLIARAARDGKQDAVVEGLFQAYFMRGEDIGDRDVLVRVAAAAGLDGPGVAAYLASGEDADRVRAEDAMARKMGVQGVPCFIFDRKYAVSGAQDPAVFLELFERLAKEADTGPAPAA